MKILKRILLTPFILIYGLLITLAGTILAFPLAGITVISLLILLVSPFIWLLNFTLETKIETDDWGFGLFDNTSVINDCLLGTTIIIWLPFYVVYIYVVEGRVFSIN